jgi:hypothetical protein
MSILSLTRYLTKRNLQYLSVMFRIILAPAEPAYASLWKRFEEILPPGTASEARQRLGELRDILEEYRSSRS